MRIYKILSLISLIIIILGGIHFFLNLRKPELTKEWRIEKMMKEGIKDFEVDNEGRIYLLCGNRIKVYSSEGKFLQDIGQEGNLMSYIMEGLHSYRKVGGEIEGEFISLADIAIDESGYIYAADSLLNVIQKFDRNGKFIKKWGGYGRERGKFYEHLVGIAGIDLRGNIYAYDNERIQKFDSEGNYLSTIMIESRNGRKTFIKIAYSGLIYIFSIYEKKVYIYEYGNLKESIKVPEERGKTTMLFDMDIDRDGDIYLLTKDYIVKLSQTTGKTKKLKLKKEKIPFLFKIDKEGKQIYLISFISSPFSLEEKADVYIQIYKAL